MKNTKTAKKVMAVAIAVGAIAVISGAAFAATYRSPAEAAAGLTGKTVDEVVAERAETGKTYGQIADEAGKLEEFKEEKLAIRKEVLDERVAAGTLTQEEADAILARTQERMEACDGTCTPGSGENGGFGFRQGNGDGSGAGYRGGGRNGMRGQNTCGGTNACVKE